MAVVIAVTGGIGSGKSSVAASLVETIGALFLDADALCRCLLAPAGAGWQAVRDKFGSEFFLENGQIDRPLLRQSLFADPQFRQQLDALLHPLVREEIRREIAADAGRSPRIVVEVPLLYEAGWEHDFSSVIVVYADCERALARLMARDRIDRVEAVREMAAQLPLIDKALRADHVIDNSGCWWDTWLQIRHLGALLSSGHDSPQ